MSPPFFTQGCNTTLTDFLEANVITIGAIGLALAALEVYRLDYTRKLCMIALSTCRAVLTLNNVTITIFYRPNKENAQTW